MNNTGSRNHLYIKVSPRTGVFAPLFWSKNAKNWNSWRILSITSMKKTYPWLFINILCWNKRITTPRIPELIFFSFSTTYPGISGSPKPIMNRIKYKKSSNIPFSVNCYPKRSHQGNLINLTFYHICQLPFMANCVFRLELKETYSCEY